MDFADTPAEATFRASARAWLEHNAPTPRGRIPWPDDAALVAAASAWQGRKAAEGYAGITLPSAYGGRGGSASEQVIFRQEESRFEVPFGVYEIGLGMCVPTLLAVGDSRIRDRYVRPAIEGREIWCQLFSEPSAGSDLAALATRAVRDDSRWIVNGQKVWTTGAQFSDFGLLLARTDPDVFKHSGLTLFVVNMHAPGVEVRPIRQISGEAEFNEVFFTDVVIEDAERLTVPGGGWAGAMTTLMFERLNVGADIGLVDYRTLLATARTVDMDGLPAIESPLVRDALARCYLNDRGLKLLTFRTITALGRDRLPGPEQSITKLIIASQAQAIADLLLDLREEEGALAGRDLGVDWGAVERSWSMAAGMRIAGGTDEILRNVIAERVLGLPPEPRTDKARPYSDAMS